MVPIGNQIIINIVAKRQNFQIHFVNNNKNNREWSGRVSGKDHNSSYAPTWIESTIFSNSFQESKFMFGLQFLYLCLFHSFEWVFLLLRLIGLTCLSPFITLFLSWSDFFSSFGYLHQIDFLSVVCHIAFKSNHYNSIS